MDSRIGLDYIVENAEYTTKLGAGKTKQCFFSKSDLSFEYRNLSLNAQLLAQLYVLMGTEVVNPLTGDFKIN